MEKGLPGTREPQGGLRALETCREAVPSQARCGGAPAAEGDRLTVLRAPCRLFRSRHGRGVVTPLARAPESESLFNKPGNARKGNQGPPCGVKSVPGRHTDKAWWSHGIGGGGVLLTSSEGGG